MLLLQQVLLQVRRGNRLLFLRLRPPFHHLFLPQPRGPPLHPQKLGSHHQRVLRWF